MEAVSDKIVQILSPNTTLSCSTLICTSLLIRNIFLALMGSFIMYIYHVGAFCWMSVAYCSPSIAAQLTSHPLPCLSLESDHQRSLQTRHYLDGEPAWGWHTCVRVTQAQPCIWSFTHLMVTGLRIIHQKHQDSSDPVSRNQLLHWRGTIQYVDRPSCVLSKMTFAPQVGGECFRNQTERTSVEIAKTGHNQVSATPLTFMQKLKCFFFFTHWALISILSEVAESFIAGKVL